ncbi:hypothetical protein [Natrinema sp. H-ect4]|uniref:hypothetical protein n=1 Tax=Natrinema sp. H-ect4 TaxID=3242699 RepID=UPI0035A98454
MGDEDSDGDSFEWDLQSSRVSVGGKLPIPEDFRDGVVMDSGNDSSTWWGYDKEAGYAFLSSDYTNGGRFITINNRSYKLEKGSRVTIPKPESEEVTEGVLGGSPPSKHSVVYFYSDSRMDSCEPYSVIVLSKEQLAEVIDNEELFSELFDATDIGGAPGPTPSNLAKEVRESDKERLEEEISDETFQRRFPVPE